VAGATLHVGLIEMSIFCDIAWLIRSSFVFLTYLLVRFQIIVPFRSVPMLGVCAAILLASARPDAALASGSPLICFGNEPSWSVDLTQPGTARVMLPDEQPMSYRGAGIRNELLREEIWRGTPDAGRDLVVFLRDATCSDGMSEAKHPVTARVSLPDGRFLAGCCRIPVAPREAATNTTLEGVSWRLTTLAGKAPQLSPGSSRPVTVRFEAGRVAGFSGCNTFTGSYAIDGDRVTLGRLATTMMACPEPEMALESAFHAALSGTVHYSIQADQLRLIAASGTVLVFEAEPPPRLEGVTWEVTGFNNNRHAVISLVADAPITLSFEQGTVSGNAGCNTFWAPYSADGNRVKIGPAATTRKACSEERMGQERAFLAALESAVTWSLEGGVLDMHRADGERALMANIKR
jgi:heat shock protein HslJ